MKIGIITFHFPYNCGAALQCVALKTYLENLQHEVFIINYRPWYHQNRYTPLKNPIYFALKCMQKNSDHDRLYSRFYRGVSGFLRSIYAWRKYPKGIQQHRKFNNFVKKFIPETRVYRSLNELKKNPPDFNLYISGSDQLWNANLTEGKFDPAYFLKFGNDQVMRISYAVGTNFGNVQSVEVVLKELINGFDAISLREEKYLNIVQSISSEIPISINLDPVFLLEEKDFEPMSGTDILEDEPFILTYCMPDVSQHKIINAAKIFSQKSNIKVIDISGDPTKTNTKIMDNRTCGPDEFLWYFKNAKYVFTNSFHGTAFSIIYRKQFGVIPHSKTGNRVEELLTKLELSSICQNNGEALAKNIEIPVDYSIADKLLFQIKNESKLYLIECLRKAATR